MHPVIKRVMRSLPSFQQQSEHDELLLKIFASSSAERIQGTKHRPYTTLNAELGIGLGSTVDDRRIVERLLKAYRRSTVDPYGNSLWRGIFEVYHKDSHEVFMHGDLEEARRILANPAASNIFYGFDELCTEFRQRFGAAPKGIALWCQDYLIRLAEAIGAYRLENPEGGEGWLGNAATPTDRIVHDIEAALGAEISFPDIYPGVVGARSCRGIITFRAVHALYLAFRLHQLIQSNPHRTTPAAICEIGAGLGRSALNAWRFGLKDYTLVDVPMTIISQGYYLMRCLGEDAVVLPGEVRHNREQIRLMHCEDFFSSGDRFDLVVNMDSLTELGQELALQYLRKCSEITPSFLSINHEVNPIRVIDLLKQVDGAHHILRYPYWMRSGYVEELVCFQP